MHAASKPSVAATAAGGEKVMGASSSVQPNQRPVLEDTFSRFHSYLRISLTERCKKEDGVLVEGVGEVREN